MESAGGGVAVRKEGAGADREEDAWGLLGFRNT